MLNRASGHDANCSQKPWSCKGLWHCGFKAERTSVESDDNPGKLFTSKSTETVETVHSL